MIRFSVCLETIFNALPLAERIEQAAACGVAAIEFWQWKDKDLDVIARGKEAAGVDVAALGGLEQAIPNDPATADAATAELLESVATARQIGAKGVIVHTGQALKDLGRDVQFETVAQVIDAAADEAGRAHADLLLEPRNARTDFPGTLLSSTAEALTIIDRIDRPNVKLLFDVYHQFITEGSVLHLIEAHIDRIGHFHVADVPGRGEPGTGALEYKEIFGLIDSLGYTGYVGLEFNPSGDHAEAVKNTLNLSD